MSESNVLLAEVNYIKNKVDSIEKIQMLNLRSNKALKEEYIALFREDKTLSSVYKAVDGIRNQGDIVSAIASSKATVSRKLSTLLEYGLIEIKSIDGTKKVYKHTAAEKAFGLTKVEVE